MYARLLPRRNTETEKTFFKGPFWRLCRSLIGLGFVFVGISRRINLECRRNLIISDFYQFIFINYTVVLVTTSILLIERQDSHFVGIM